MSILVTLLLKHVQEHAPTPTQRYRASPWSHAKSASPSAWPPYLRAAATRTRLNSVCGGRLRGRKTQSDQFVKGAPNLSQQAANVAGIMASMWQRFTDWLRSLFFKKEMELSLIGLQNAGKTSLVNVLTTGAFHEDMIPTVGFNMRKVTKGAVTIKLWDLGGQPRFRSMWERYCRGVQAIVYVVDAADHDGLDSGRQELHGLLQKPSLAHTPLLVLGNKNDLPGALSTTELIERLDLKALQDREVCVYSISCKNQTNIDKTIEWLMKHAKS